MGVHIYVHRCNAHEDIASAYRDGFSVECDIGEGKKGRIVLAHDQPQKGGNYLLLEEALKFVPDDQVIRVEIKTRSKKFTEKLAKLLKSSSDVEEKRIKVQLVCFSRAPLHRLKKILPPNLVDDFSWAPGVQQQAPKWLIAAVNPEKNDAAWWPPCDLILWAKRIVRMAKRAEITSLDIHAGNAVGRKDNVGEELVPLNHRLISLAQDSGLDVYAWTVNGKERAKELVRMGAAGLTVDGVFCQSIRDVVDAEASRQQVESARRGSELQDEYAISFHDDRSKSLNPALALA
ncbi:MAG: glycerophosphodiester phosphodiesterase [bacterium]